MANNPFRRNEILSTKSDIIKFAVTEYGWSLGESNKLIFEVVKTNEFLKKCDNQLLGSTQIAKKNLVFIVDVGDSHWVTLVIVYRDEQFFAYYIDPLGENADHMIRNHLTSNNIHCPSITVRQTASDTGIFALKNAQEICKEPSLTDGIWTCLQKITPKLSNKLVRYVRLTDLDSELDGFLSSHSQGTNMDLYTAGISSPDSHFATIIVGFRDEQVVACYIANHNTFTDDIKIILTNKRIASIFFCDDIHMKITKLNLQLNTEIESLTYQIEMSVKGYFSKKDDYVASAQKKLNYTFSEKDIEKVALKLKAIVKIQEKIERCLSVIKKHAQYLKGDKSKIFFPQAELSIVKANILILFLESTALQDKELSRAFGSQIEGIRQRIMGDGQQLEDFTIINMIRSQHLIHRMNYTNTVISYSDLKVFIRDGILKVELFNMLHTYLVQMNARLKGEIVTREEKIKVSSFFTTNRINGNIGKTITIEETKIYLSKWFLKFIRTNSYSSNDRQALMFELVVNIVPLLENLYRKNENKELETEELQNIKKVKNELLHKFHTYQAEIERQFELKNYVLNMKPTFFKFVYSQEVVKLLDRYTQLPNFQIEQELRKSFSDTLKKFYYVADEFCDQSRDLNFDSIALGLHQETSSNNPLKTFVSNYVKIMLFFDNEDEIGVRERKITRHRFDWRQPENQQLPEQYDRPSEVRLYIFEVFNLLKKAYLEVTSPEYKSLEKKFGNELRYKCEVSPVNFVSIVKLYVKGQETVDKNLMNILISKIYHDIAAISRMIKREGKDLKISDTIVSYGRRGSLQARNGCRDEEFKRIPRGKKVNINGNRKPVSTDTFVVNILRLFDSVASQYRNVFNNVEEVLSDETFLSFLTHGKTNISNAVWNTLLRINCLSPFVAELIVRDQLDNRMGLVRRGLVGSDTFNAIIDQLLENKLFAPRIKTFFSLENTTSTWKLLQILNSQNQCLQHQQFSQEDSFSDFWLLCDKEHVTGKLHKVICERLNEFNINNAYCLFQDKTHAIAILNELNTTITTNNGTSYQSTNLLKKTLFLLHSISQEIIYVEDKKDNESLLLSAADNLVISYSNHVLRDPGSLLEYGEAFLASLRYDMEYCIYYLNSVVTV